MPDVLLLHPYVLSHHGHHLMAYRPYPPMALLETAAILRAAGYSVEIYDGTFQAGTAPLRERLVRAPRPRVAYIQSMSSFRTGAVAAIELMKELGWTVVAGGPDPSLYDAEYLANGVDVVVRCHVDVALPLLLPALGIEPGRPEQLPRMPKEEALLAIPGVSFLDTEVRARRSPDLLPPPSPPPPLPAYDLVDVARYTAEWRRVHGYASLQLATARSCALACMWCTRAGLSRGYGPEAAPRVVEEAERAVLEHGVEHLSILDDAFTARREFVEAFTDTIHARGLRVRWECRARLQDVDRTLLERMREAGCERIRFTIESGSERVLRALGRGTTPEVARRVARDMHALGLAMAGHVLFGYPGEEWGDIERTIALVRDLAPIDCTTGVACPAPGSEHFELARGMTHVERWASSEPGHFEWDAPYSPAFYRAVDVLLAAEYDAALEFSVERYARAKLLRGLLSALRWVGDGRDGLLRFEGWRSSRVGEVLEVAEREVEPRLAFASRGGES